MSTAVAAAYLIVAGQLLTCDQLTLLECANRIRLPGVSSDIDHREMFGTGLGHKIHADALRPEHVAGVVARFRQASHGRDPAGR